ncbi:MAG: hypothetical protein QNJ54_36905 [Prochloraceae cyanobacterium]|nr:hypothetical protein [Prochloraceae cyanobacterium]
MAGTKYAPGKNPNSLANLKPGCGGRHKTFESEDKKKRNLSVTETGWQGSQLVVKKYGCKSVSEFLEKLGRGEVKISA